MPKIADSEVEPCPGPDKKLVCGKPADPAIQGFDGTFRCIACHRVHVELVYQESGASDPNPGSESERLKRILSVKNGEHGDAARRRAILDRFGRPTPPTYTQPFQHPDDVSPRRQIKTEEERGASEAARRAQILRKYGVDALRDVER
jgi:hypothetical protein